MGGGHGADRHEARLEMEDEARDALDVILRQHEIAADVHRRLVQRAEEDHHLRGRGGGGGGGTCRASFAEGWLCLTKDPLARKRLTSDDLTPGMPAVGSSAVHETSTVRGGVMAETCSMREETGVRLARDVG